MNKSIEKFDAYHRVARAKPLSLQEANTKLGCNFTALSADVQKAYLEYKNHYLKKTRILASLIYVYFKLLIQKKKLLKF